MHQSKIYERRSMSMKAFIFDPLWDDLVTPDLLESLKQTNVDIVVTKAIAPLSDCTELLRVTKIGYSVLKPRLCGLEAEK